MISKTYYIVDSVNGPYNSNVVSSESFTSWNYCQKYMHRLLLMGETLEVHKRVLCV